MSQYNGALTSEHFLLRETRISAALLISGLTPEEALERTCEQNLFQYPTKKKMTSLSKACLRRLLGLNSEALVRLVAEGPLQEARQIILYAMMRDNALVREFMVQVIGEKLADHDTEYARQDINVFFARLQAQNEQVAAWSDSTVQKLKSVLVRCLYEVGFIDSVLKARTPLHPVYAGEALEESIRANGDAGWAFRVFTLLNAASSGI